MEKATSASKSFLHAVYHFYNHIALTDRESFLSDEQTNNKNPSYFFRKILDFIRAPLTQK